MADLITLARAKEEFGGAIGSADTALNAAEDTTLSALITATSSAAIRSCRRDFSSTSYDEVYPPNCLGLIVLNNFPTITITSVRADPEPVIQIQQTDTVTNQYATIAPASAGLSLSRTASGTTTTVTTGLTYAANPTIDAMVAAILALVGTTLPGWTARAVSPYGLFPSADLYIASTQIAPASARGTYTPLYMHVNNLTNYLINPNVGSLQPGHINWGPLHKIETYHPYPTGSIRVKYLAGYSTIPLDLQSAIAQWVAALFYKTKARDPNSGNTFSATAGSSFVELEANMPPFTRTILQTYKSRNILAKV